MSDAYLWKRRPRTVFDGEYSEAGSKRVMLKLDQGRFQWGFVQGFYKVLKRTPASLDLGLIYGFFEQRKHPHKYRLTRRKSTYVLANLEDGTERRFKRKDEKIFLTDSFLEVKKQAKERPRRGALTPEGWKMIKDSKVGYHLTGESGLSAITIPAPPSSKQLTVVRVTHTNGIGYVDSDLFVRLGSPKSPIGATDFDTVQDWHKMALVEDLRWSDNRQEWVPRRKAAVGFLWSGTYEAGIEIPKGHHLIELKLISRVPEVCSIVLSNWKVYVR